MEELRFLVKSFEVEDYVNDWKLITLQQICDRDEDGFWVSQESETPSEYYEMSDHDLLDDMDVDTILEFVEYKGYRDNDLEDVISEYSADEILNCIDIKDIKDYLERLEDE